MILSGRWPWGSWLTPPAPDVLDSWSPRSKGYRWSFAYLKGKLRKGYQWNFSILEGESIRGYQNSLQNRRNFSYLVPLSLRHFDFVRTGQMQSFLQFHLLNCSPCPETDLSSSSKVASFRIPALKKRQEFNFIKPNHWTTKMWPYLMWQRGWPRSGALPGFRSSQSSLVKQWPD